MARVCNSLWHGRVFAPASARAGKQPSKRSLTRAAVCKAVSSCAVTSSLPRKLRSPLWEEDGGRSPSSALWLHPSPGQDTASRTMPPALTHPKAREIKGGVRGRGSEEAALVKLLLGVGLHHQWTWTRGRWHQWLHQTLGVLVKPMPSAHKNCLSRAVYPFHRGEKSPFQQYSNNNKRQE